MKKSLFTLTTVAVVGLSSAFFSSTASANTVSDLESKQTKLEEEREQIKKDLSEADAQIADILIDLEEIKHELKELETAQEENALVIEETEASIEAYEEEIIELEDEITTLEESIVQRDEILKERISSYQQNGGNISFIDVLFGSDNFGDFISRISAVTKITNSDQQLIDELEADRNKVVAIQNEVEEKLVEQEDLREDLKEYEVVLKQQKEVTKESEKELKDKEKELKKVVAKLETEDSTLSDLEAQVARQLSEARNPAPVVAASDSSSGGGNLTTLTEEEPTTSNVPQTSSGSGSAIDAAYSQLGVSNRYVFGGKSPGGFDCSGFVSWAYGEAGQSLPSNTRSLRTVGTKVSISEAQPGDLIFFTNPGGQVDGHVGIYLGNGNFIGSQSSTGVAIESIYSNSYWKGAFKGHVRRVN